MRHRRKINHLSRKTAHRKAMLANMASSLILHKRIKTTVAKAKALRVYVEPLITKSKLSVTTKKSKEEATHLRRVVFSYLQNKEAVTELFREVSAKVVDREGGYTRIIKTGTRLGDNAEMCMMELVDYNENLLSDKAKTEGKSKRRRRGAKKKEDETPVAQAAVAETTADEVVEEVSDQVETEVPTEEIVSDTETKEQVTEEKAEPVVEDKSETPVQETETAETKVPEDKTGDAVAEVKTETPEVKSEEVVEDKKEDEGEEGVKDKDESK